MNEDGNKVRKSYFDSLYKSGSGGVHLVGGASALVSAWLVGPRLGRWQLTTAPPMGSPTNALIGLYMLWWGWLAFNADSTFGET